ncbi:basic leucine zipper transcriptional factor ATF-like 3-like [Scleropages formosus]|uniref:Basic leucine zipper transcriptional factor ATF-like 3-like n=1 Tax=Scleropages formosus TaxID=113540 RepID=A0A0P7UFB1_SCLFO|nr:basic leucine zipper transcriptional factor ATF-like 3-like [Scleropages formosus]
MSAGARPTDCLRGNAGGLHALQGCESSEDDERKQKRREKNRVAAQRSRKKQTQRADQLHERSEEGTVVHQGCRSGEMGETQAPSSSFPLQEYECLEQENLLLRKEVQMLTEEQRHLMEVLKAHEPLCPIVHCSANLTSHPRAQVLAGGLLR